MSRDLKVFTFEPSEHAVDNQERRNYRDALGLFPTGITIVTALSDSGEKIGLTVNSFTSVSLHPPLILFAVALRANSAAVFQPGTRFAVNILSAEQEELARHFARYHPDKFAEVVFTPGRDGVPILGGSSAWLEAAVQDVHPSGDHLLIVGRVDRFAHCGDAPPLIYHRGQYRHLD
jgi:flavin reductase (DIM6/NTAB) family NADH-FMN oxidoreductase RutF